MSGICPELDARLSAELDRYYFSTDGSGLNLDRREKHCVINALHRLWNIEEIACYREQREAGRDEKFSAQNRRKSEKIGSFQRLSERVLREFRNKFVENS